MSLPCWAGRMGCGDTCWAETSPWSRAQFLSNLPSLLLCLTPGMQAPGPEQRIPRTEPGTRERLLLGTRDAATLFWPGTCFLRELFSIFHSLLWSPLSCLTQMTAERVWPLLFFFLLGHCLVPCGGPRPRGSLQLPSLPPGSEGVRVAPRGWVGRWKKAASSEPAAISWRLPKGISLGVAILRREASLFVAQHE